MITLILADDHPTTRAGLHTILEAASDIQIVGDAQDGFEAMKFVKQYQPNILLLDLKMPGPRPAEIEKWVRRKFPKTITLILTAHDRDAYLAQMIDAGVSGYITKSERGDRLIYAIRKAANGESIITENQYSRAHKWFLEAGQKWSRLTKREREILKLIGRGLGNSVIANDLSVSYQDVAFHVTNLLGKLELKNRQEAAAWFYKYFPDDLE